MIDIDHLSYSSISLFLSCPRAWKFRYVDKIYPPKSDALIFGSAFHKTLAQYLSVSGESLCDLWEIFAEQEGITSEELLERGFRIFEDHEVQEVIENIQPLPTWIERKIEWRVSGVDVPLIGYIDVITNDHVPCDFKTSSRRWSTGRASAELQPLFYLGALDQQQYSINHQYRFRYYVFTDSPSIQIIEVQKSPQQIEFVEDMIREVWAAIKTERFYCNPTAWTCSRDYCGYWEQCCGRHDKPIELVIPEET